MDKSYECVEPRLGQELWRHAMPDLEPGIRAELEDHLSVCAACRLELAAQDRLTAAVASGAVSLRPRRPAWVRTASWSAAVALAACLALIFVLPPRGIGDGLLLRGDPRTPRIERPVAGEVALSRRPQLAWTPIEDATAYRVELRSVDGTYAWSAEVSGTRVTVPDSAALPPGERLRLLVRPVPSYVGPAEGLSSTFRTGSAIEFAGYRLKAAPLWIWGLAGLCGLAFLFLRRFHAGYRD